MGLPSNSSTTTKNPLASSGGTRAAGCPWGDLFGGMFRSGGRPCELGLGGKALFTGSICQNRGGFDITPWRERDDVMT